ncbi:enoyl-CoA hydratase/isomerase family protein [Saccharopolyspora shandongensis]|uniref:enoyl-CoA hydratase/isomerase family protein n=1 Tax=Saccharopolyspora shandongensis TaxID=418495 RepID=UPI003444009A
MGQDVLVRRHASWLQIELNRPDRRNALTAPMVAEIAKAVDRASTDDGVQAVLLSGAGGCFCSGLDLDHVAPGEPEITAELAELHSRLAELDKPLVGALERAAVNAGAALALACDLLVIGRESFLMISEASMGVAAPHNLAWLLRKYDVNRALQLALGCERTYGPDMLRLGLASHCVSDPEVLTAARELTARIAGYGNSGGTRMKRAIREHHRGND